MNASRLLPELERKARNLPALAGEVRCAICAREAVDDRGDALALTAAEIFSS